MAALKQIEFETPLPNKHDADRNEKLGMGIVKVETTEEQSVLSALPEADVNNLADALKRLLTALNAKSEETKRIWCWHLALTHRRPPKGEVKKGGPVKPVEKVPPPVPPTKK
jgi:hypothetical protein